MTTRKLKAIPPCAAMMGCLCWGHAIGDPVDAACNTDERRTDLDVSDTTPTVIPTFVTKEPDVDRCASCGEEVSILATAWIWRGRIFCDKRRCKPLQRRGAAT